MQAETGGGGCDVDVDVDVAAAVVMLVAAVLATELGALHGTARAGCTTRNGTAQMAPILQRQIITTMHQQR